MVRIFRACWQPSGVLPDDAPVFAVRVGTSAKEIRAVRRLEALKLSGDLYFEPNDDVSAEFFGKLLSSSPFRPIYNVTAAELLRFIENPAYAAHVENLSKRFRRERVSQAVATHVISPFQAKTIFIKNVNL